MPHLPHRSFSAKPPVAVEAEAPIQKYERAIAQNFLLERQMGSTRAPRHRILKPPIA